MIGKKNKLWINSGSRSEDHVEAEENGVVEKSRKHVVITGTGSEYGKTIRDVERKWLDDGEEEQSRTH